MKPTVRVELYGSLTRHTGGEGVVEVDAASIRDVYAALKVRFPALAASLDGGVSVSIDGRIYTESLFETVNAENEIIILPRIAGG
ncbi:MAG: MoaD/ThiS family protein [Pseudomonadota bacterium]